MAKPRGPAIRNVITISDLHAGSQLGLCHPDGARLSEGGLYKPSKLQRKLWRYWEEFTQEWLPSSCRNEPFDPVINGDTVDGKPFESKSQITDNITDQALIAHKILEPLVRAARRTYFVKGTETHVGKCGENEERLARELGAVPDECGQHARQELWYRLGGDLIHFLHHIGSSSRSAYESSAVMAELIEEFVEAARWGEQPPSVIARSHRHSCLEIRIPADVTARAWSRTHVRPTRAMAIAFVTPAWQLKTPFAHKIPGARLKPPQLGGSLIRLSDEGVIYVTHYVQTIGRPQEVP